MEEDGLIHTVEMLERLELVAVTLEQAAQRMAEQQAAVQQVAALAAAQENVGRITATVEGGREADLERRLAEAEQRIAQLTAAAETTGRRTLPVGTASLLAGSLLAKQGVAMEHGGVAMEASALDGALASLSIEQRIAVKAELLRAGLL